MVLLTFSNEIVPRRLAFLGLESVVVFDLEYDLAAATARDDDEEFCFTDFYLLSLSSAGCASSNCYVNGVASEYFRAS